MGKLGSVGFQKAIRLRRIDNAWKGTIQHSEIVQNAIKELEIVIGSYHGELTEGMDRFFRELERTGLVTALAEQCLLNERRDTIKRTFIDLHDAVFISEKSNSAAFYDKLCNTVQVALRELIQDQALLMYL